MHNVCNVLSKTVERMPPRTPALSPHGPASSRQQQATRQHSRSLYLFCAPPRYLSSRRSCCGWKPPSRLLRFQSQRYIYLLPNNGRPCICSVSLTITPTFARSGARALGHSFFNFPLSAATTSAASPDGRHEALAAALCRRRRAARQQQQQLRNPERHERAGACALSRSGVARHQPVKLTTRM